MFLSRQNFRLISENGNDFRIENSVGTLCSYIKFSEDFEESGIIRFFFLWQYSGIERNLFVPKAIPVQGDGSFVLAVLPENPQIEESKENLLENNSTELNVGVCEPSNVPPQITFTVFANIFSKDLKKVLEKK